MWVSRKKAEKKFYVDSLRIDNDLLRSAARQCARERAVLKVERDAARERVGVLLAALGDVVNLPMHSTDATDIRGGKMLAIPIHADARAPTSLPDEYCSRLASWVASVCLRQGARLGAAGLRPTGWHLINDNQLGIRYTEGPVYHEEPEAQHG